MDPISLIIEALAAGAAAALKDTAGKAIKEGYVALKSAIKRAWSDPETSDVLLNEYEKDPETYQKPIEKKLKEKKLDDNQDIIALAQAVLKQTDPEGHAKGKYQVTISHSQKFQVGDGNTQYNY